MFTVIADPERTFSVQVTISLVVENVKAYLPASYVKGEYFEKDSFPTHRRTGQQTARCERTSRKERKTSQVARKKATNYEKEKRSLQSNI